MKTKQLDEKSVGNSYVNKNIIRKLQWIHFYKMLIYQECKILELMQFLCWFDNIPVIHFYKTLNYQEWKVFKLMPFLCWLGNIPVMVAAKFVINRKSVTWKHVVPWNNMPKPTRHFFLEILWEMSLGTMITTQKPNNN